MTTVRPGRTTRVRKSSNRSSIPPLRGLIPLLLALSLWQVFGPEQSVYAPRPSEWVKEIFTLTADGTLADTDAQGGQPVVTAAAA